MRRNRFPTAHKYVNYSGGSNTLNYSIKSRLLKSGPTLTELHIWRRLITPQLPYPRYQITNGTKRFTEFGPVEAIVGEIEAAVAALVKVAETATASTITRGRSTQDITRIGKA